MKKATDWANVLLSFVASLLTMFLVWGEFNPRFVVFFVFYLAIAAAFVHVRWRMSLPCPHCHFDPLVYKNDREEAVRRVQQKLDQIKQAGTYMLKQNNPLSTLAKQKKSKLQGAIPAETSKYLSRQI